MWPRKVGLWPYGRGAGESYSISHCSKCAKIYDSIYHLNRHYREEHKKVEMTPDKHGKDEMFGKWECSLCDPEPEFDDPDLQRAHFLDYHPELKIIL